MNDAAYDISHLLELEAIAPAVPEFRSSRPATVKPELSAVAAAQDALEQELLQIAERHDELIQQYISMKGDSMPDSDR